MIVFIKGLNYNHSTKLSLLVPAESLAEDPAETKFQSTKTPLLKLLNCMVRRPRG
jgi:hypothetical protein